ncbi:uncharacterized protein LOC129741389 [Uranotaenia lowii]|uniref:uncharacterized protein LOC129741389 n=1 Tax=Uranotaenia lowii TaxID=190385 RepID=UPI002479A931|nr:uncharacterized protein LOC129741389 [Uranotaenia lowii]XP_055589180.1 uncharacterized protein LOC129741389 [Uranotaenia lowii]XP_055589244.1 uncharacterized protein LOC129741389 [Uranotaenia lowii]XP_055589300.1 uncharacterized protein LOC129741389 [Uranotaenia lowii]XP_055589363.1 uncharacterized protein LOC129741389 [Uranotaenia lowii]
MCAERSFPSCLYNTLVFMQLLYVTRSFGVIYDEYVVDQGKNLTLLCKSPHPVMWVHEGRRDNDFQQFQSDGSLQLTNLTAKDGGLYTCSELIPPLTTIQFEVSENVTDSSSVDHHHNDSSQNVTTSSDSSSSSSRSSDDDTGTDVILSSTPLLLFPGDQDDVEEEDDVNERYVEIRRVRVKIRTAPQAVSNFFVRASTIIAVLVWEVMPNRTGGYAIRDFTAEMRRLRMTEEEPEERWETIDPRHISPNARQLEIYHLVPNTTYEFRIWANNALGAGDIMTITATTLPDMEEKDLIRRIMIDAQNFDTRVWIAAVGVVMGTLVILSLGTCIVLYKECREPIEKEEELDSLELVPNIILNPGFCDSDDQGGQEHLSPPVPRTLAFLPVGPPGAQRNRSNSAYPSYAYNSRSSNSGRYHYGNGRGPPNGGGADDDDDDDDDYDEEPMTFSRRMSIFFTGNTIKRI